MKKEKTEFKVLKVLDIADVREMCIEHQYYTHGDNRAYSNMFDMIPRCEDISDEILTQVAQDILDHSRTDDTLEDILIYLAFRIKCVVEKR